MLNKHPNATVALVSGSGLGSLVAWAAGELGWHPTAAAAAAIAGGISTVALFVGRNGVRGLAHALWRGTGEPTGS